MDFKSGQRVRVTVERVFPFGVFVRLDDGTRAYIRHRELDLDRDVDPASVVSEGDTLSAIVLSPAEDGRHIELSRRAALPDPWEDFAKQFRVGDVVRGTVRRLLPEGTFVRIRPGVDGFVPLVALATWPVGKPEDLLWPGDSVQAVITRLDRRGKKTELSIKARMQQWGAAAAFAERLAERDVATPATLEGKGIPEETASVTSADHVRVVRILVVDDQNELREQLAIRLAQHGYQVSQAQSMAEALHLMEQQEFSVLLVDLHLPDGDGLEIVHRMVKRVRRPWICLMSSPEWLADRGTEIKRARIARVFLKPLDLEEIDHFLLQIAYGREPPPSQWMSSRKEPVGGPFIELFTAEITATTRSERLERALQKLTEIVRAEEGILFAMDPLSQTVSIVLRTGIMAIQAEAVYQLSDSPVKNVICEREPVFKNRVSGQAEGRFRKLLNLLPFESCLGVPVETYGELRHAAFFFHRKPDAFTPYRLQDVLAGAIWLGASLERQRLDERLRSSGGLLLSGELALGCSHEVYNKVSGLELMLQNFAAGANDPEEGRIGLSTMSELVRDLKEMTGMFLRLTQAREEREQIDVNEIIRRAELLLRPFARKERITLALHLAPDLPLVWGNSAWLQQAFLNILLNAVQQMALKPDKHRLLEIKTACRGNGRCSLIVRFTDTGPGIHQELWERIFTLGFTTRPGGTGLGLFLVRSLLEAIGGSARVEESYIPLGTTFLVELPALERKEER